MKGVSAHRKRGGGTQRRRTKSSGVGCRFATPRNRNRPWVVETIPPGFRLSSCSTRFEAISAISPWLGCCATKLSCLSPHKFYSLTRGFDVRLPLLRLIWEGSSSWARQLADSAAAKLTDTMKIRHFFMSCGYPIVVDWTSAVLSKGRAGGEISEVVALLPGIRTSNPTSMPRNEAPGVQRISTCWRPVRPSRRFQVFWRRQAPSSRFHLRQGRRKPRPIQCGAEV